MSVRSTIARNTFYNAAGRLWEFAAGIVLMRIIVEYIGVGELGLWALVGPFIGYVALLDIGIGSGFSKYIAEHAARDEHRALSEVVSTGFYYYLLFGAVIVAIGWPLLGLGIDAVAHWAGLAATSRNDLRFLFQWGLVLFAASNCITAFTAIQTGLQRMGVTNALSFMASVVKIVGTVYFLARGQGVRGLLYAEGLSTGTFALASVVAAFCLRPSLRVSPRLVSWPAFRRLFGFGWRTQIAHLSNLVMFQTDKVVVGGYYSLLGVPAVARAQIGFYELGVNMANKMRQGPIVLTSALLPAASDLHARNEHDRLKELYLRSTKYLALVTVPAALFTAAAAGIIMRAWMGEGFDRSAWILRIIVVGYIANVVPGAGVSVVLGQGRSGIIMKAGLVSMCSNLLLTIGLVLTIGFWGIPIATATSMIISWAWFAHVVRDDFDVGFGSLLRRTLLWPVLAAAPAVIPCVLFDRWGAVHPGFLTNLTLLAAAACAFALVYALIMPRTPFMDSEDLRLLDSTLPLDRIPMARAWLRRAAHV